jgi:hypothetical protein
MKKKIKKEVNEGGRPCEFCKDPTIQSRADKYISECNSEIKPKIPYIQEFAMLVDVDRDTIVDWANKKLENGELEHPMFYRTVKKLMTHQEFRLLQRTLGRFNPTGAIFQLKVNHKYIETEKKILGGDSNEPLEIRIVEDKLLPEDAE